MQKIASNLDSPTLFYKYITVLPLIGARLVGPQFLWKCEGKIRKQRVVMLTYAFGHVLGGKKGQEGTTETVFRASSNQSLAVDMSFSNNKTSDKLALWRWLGDPATPWVSRANIT